MGLPKTTFGNTLIVLQSERSVIIPETSELLNYGGVFYTLAYNMLVVPTSFREVIKTRWYKRVFAVFVIVSIIRRNNLHCLF